MPASKPSRKPSGKRRGRPPKSLSDQILPDDPLEFDIPTDLREEVDITGSSRGEGLREMDFQIAFCKILDMTQLETARAVSTPIHPQGISAATVVKRLKLNREWIDRMVSWGASLRREVMIDAKEIAADQLRSEMEKDLGFSWGLIKKAIKEGNTDLAMWHIEQAIGKASQPHSLKVGGKVQHEMIWQPERKLLAQESDITGSDDLLKALPKDVLEAEMIND